MRRHRGFVVVAALALVATGCDATPDPIPTPISTSASSTPSPSAKPETQEQKDIAAATTAYRRQFAEVARLTAAGGSSTATPVLRETTTSAFLDFVEKNQRLIKNMGAHLRGTPKLLGTSSVNWTGSSISFEGCEDWSSTYLYKGSKRLPRNTTGKYIQHLVARVGSDGRWRIASQTGTTQVNDITSRTCSHGFQQ